MRIFRSATQAALSAMISFGAFGFMALLFLLSPKLDDPVSIEDGSGHEAVYVADVSALMESLAAEEAIALEPAEPEPEPAPIVPEPEAAPPPSQQISADAAPPSEPLAAEAPPPSNADARPPRSSHGRQIAEVHQARRAAAAAAAAANKPSRRKRNCEEGTDAITKVSANRYEVERDLVDYYTHDISEAMTLAAVYWYREDGDIVGFRIRRIKCGSVLHQAGIRNGDVVRSINGRPVTTIPQALSAYRKLRRKRKLEVELIRRSGEAVSLRYKLT